MMFMKYVVAILLLFGLNFLMSGVNVSALMLESTSQQSQLQTDDTESPQPSDHSEDPYFCSIDFSSCVLWEKKYTFDIFNYQSSLSHLPIKPPDSV
jgi:hypothetical protein